jgi:hypothetical protein
MSCQQPTHSVNQSQLRKEILEGINNEYEVLKRSLESGSQVDPGINDDIIELMNRLLENNISNGKILVNQQSKLSEVERSLQLNKAYLQSLKDTIEHNEDSKLVISNRINTGKDKSKSISKQFIVYLSVIVILFLAEIGVLIFV